MTDTAKAAINDYQKRRIKRLARLEARVANGKRGCGQQIMRLPSEEPAGDCGDRSYCSLECFTERDDCPFEDLSRCFCHSNWHKLDYTCPEAMVTAYSACYRYDHAAGGFVEDWLWAPFEWPLAVEGRYNWDTGVTEIYWVAHDGRIVWGEW